MEQLYEIFKQRELSGHKETINENKKKTHRLPSLNVEEINSEYYKALADAEDNHCRGIFGNDDMLAALAINIAELQMNNHDIDAPGLLQDLLNMNDPSANCTQSNIMNEQPIPDGMEPNTLPSGRTSIDLCQLLEKRLSQVQNRVSNLSKASRMSIDDFFVNNDSNRNSKVKNRRSVSLDGHSEDHYPTSRDNTIANLRQIHDTMQNRLAVTSSKDLPSYFAKISPQNRKPPLGVSSLFLEAKKPHATESSVLRVSPIDSSVSVVEFETSLVGLNKTRGETPTGVQGKTIRIPSKYKGPNGHLNNLGDDAVETPIMTEENVLEGEFLSFNFPDSNKASGNFDGRELPLTKEELQLRQQEWANNLPELEVIEVVEEAEDEEETPRNRKSKRHVPFGEKTPEFVFKVETPRWDTPRVRRKIFEKYENQAGGVRMDLVPDKRFESSRSYSVDSEKEKVAQQMHRDDSESLEDIVITDVREKGSEKGFIEYKRMVESGTCDFNREEPQMMDGRVSFGKEMASFERYIASDQDAGREVIFSEKKRQEEQGEEAQMNEPVVECMMTSRELEMRFQEPAEQEELKESQSSMSPDRTSWSLGQVVGGEANASSEIQQKYHEEPTYIEYKLSVRVEAEYEEERPLEPSGQEEKIHEEKHEVGLGILRRKSKCWKQLCLRRKFKIMEKMMKPPWKAMARRVKIGG